MLRRMEVLGCVPVLRTVTAAHVTAMQAHAQVNPGVAGLQALFTALCVGADVADRIEVRALLRHGVLRPSGCEEIVA